MCLLVVDLSWWVGGFGRWFWWFGCCDCSVVRLRLGVVLVLGVLRCAWLV